MIIHERQRSRLEILCEQQGHRCCYCGVRFPDAPDGKSLKKCNWKNAMQADPLLAPTMPTIEHVVRVADGGRKVWENEVAACVGCNSRRHDVDAYEFFERRVEILATRRSRPGRSGRRRLAAKEQFVRQKGKWPMQIVDVWPSP